MTGTKTEYWGRIAVLVIRGASEDAAAALPEELTLADLDEFGAVAKKIASAALPEDPVAYDFIGDVVSEFIYDNWPEKVIVQLKEEAS